MSETRKSFVPFVPTKRNFTPYTISIWQPVSWLLLFVISQMAFTLIGIEIWDGNIVNGASLSAQNLSAILFGLASSQVMCLALAAWYAFNKSKKAWTKVIGLKTWSWRWVGIALLLGMVLQGIAAVITTLIPPPDQWVSPVEELLASGNLWQLIGLAMLVAVGAPVIEEIIFRGLLQQTLLRYLPFKWTAVIIAITFAFLHMSDLKGYLIPTFIIFIAGLTLSWLRKASDTLWAPIMCHFMFNAIAILIAIFVM